MCGEQPTSKPTPDPEKKATCAFGQNHEEFEGDDYMIPQETTRKTAYKLHKTMLPAIMTKQAFKMSLMIN